MPALAIGFDQYAGIQAALAEGHALDAVLAQEGIAIASWPALDLELTDAITRDDASFASFRARLVEAEDLLARDVTPLADDLAAWTAFVSAIATAPDLLERHGLRPPDLARLERRWRKRFESDRRLAEEAEKLAAKPSKLPTIRVGEARLAPFPWTPAPGGEATASASGPGTIEAAPAAAPEPAPAEAPAIATIATPSYAIARAPLTPTPRRSLEPILTLGETAPLTGQPPSGPAVPFVRPRRAPLEPDLVLARTREGATPPKGPVLPFSSGSEAAAAAPPPKGDGAAIPATPRAGRRSLEPQGALGATRQGATPARGPTLPFERSRKSAASAGSRLEPVAFLAGTAPASDAPAAAPLPFSPPPRAKWEPEDYARFCAELDGAADPRAVLERWSIADEADRVALEASWRARLASDPDLRARFAVAMRRATRSRRG